MVEHDPALEELWLIKEQIAERFGSVRKITAEARRIAKAEPLAKPGKQRKLIPDFPRGQSVADPDPILEELRQVKDDLAKQFDNDLQKLLEHADREAPKLLAKYRKPTKGKSLRPKAAFRSSKSKSELRA